MLSSIKVRLWLSYALIIGIVVSIARATVVFYFIRNPANDRIEYQRLRLISNFLIQLGNALSLNLPDEVKALAIAFNHMTERVQTSQQAQLVLIANVSHDLKTPLTSIQGFAQAILNGTAQDTDTIQDAARVIYNVSGRMNRMVMDLLDLARMDAGTRNFDSEPIDLNALLESVLRKNLLKSKELQIELSYHCEADMLEIIGDSNLLERVFSNLVDNALKNTPSMGKVSLTARQSHAWLEISVADTGSGIPTDELARIFERFYQTDKARRGGADRGVGLGLAIAREIIRAHHGWISAYNRETIAAIQNQIEPMDDLDIGSIFVVKLPIIPMHD